MAAAGHGIVGFNLRARPPGHQAARRRQICLVAPRDSPLGPTMATTASVVGSLLTPCRTLLRHRVSRSFRGSFCSLSRPTFRRLQVGVGWQFLFASLRDQVMWPKLTASSQERHRRTDCNCIPAGLAQGPRRDRRLHLAALAISVVVVARRGLGLGLGLVCRKYLPTARPPRSELAVAASSQNQKRQIKRRAGPAKPQRPADIGSGRHS